MKVMKRFLKNENAIGLVEALVSIAIVGTGMVLITYFSLKSVKLARKNELKDIAVQTAVEAMDFMKQPGDIQIDIDWACRTSPPFIKSTGKKLDYGNQVLITRDGLEGETRIGCGGINMCGASGSDYYRVSSLDTEGKFCQQIWFFEGDSPDTWDVQVLVTWESVGGECEEYRLDGTRIGKINPDVCD
jgi:type II secretory pathway pseudopilin PulG